MPEIKNTFLKGKMNKDVDERLLSPGEYRDALNIQIATSESNNAGSLHNVLGNEKLSTLNISGGVCIGSIADTENNKLYWFIYGNNVDAIAEYDEATSAIYPVLVDNTKTIINFPNSKITAINIVEGYLAWTDDNSEPKIIDIEYFKNSSLDFNTTTTVYDDILGGYRNILESDITVIKKKPNNSPTLSLNAIGSVVQSGGVDITATGDFTGVNIGDTTTITFSADPNFEVNQIFKIDYEDIVFNTIFTCKFKSISTLTATVELTETVLPIIPTYTFTNKRIKIGNTMFESKFVRFAYRWKFKNNQYSVMSPFTEAAFFPGFEYFIDQEYIDRGYNSAMENTVKSVLLGNIDCSDTSIESVDILYKESNNSNIYIYQSIKKENLDGYGTGLFPNICTVTINGESIYSILPETQLLRNYDNVPYRAKAMEISSNRLIFGNYIDGLNITLDANSAYTQYTPEFNISLVNRISSDPTGFRSIKAYRKYQLGIVFEDEYGRQTTVYSNNSGLIENNFIRTGINQGKAFQVEMNSLPSGTSFDPRIKRFKYFIKDNNNDYYNIICPDVYIDNENANAVWLVLPSYEINKVSEGDYLIFKKGLNEVNAIDDPSAKYKVLDLKSSKPETIEAGKNFDSKFFIKIKKDNNIEQLLLSNKRLLTGSTISSGISEEDFHKIDYVPTNSLLLTYTENGNKRNTYYFKYGNIYIVETDITTTPANDLNINTAGTVYPSCNILAGNDWHYVNLNSGSPINFSDITGEVDNIYVKYEMVSGIITNITDIYICYDLATPVLSYNAAIFERLPKDNLLDIYYETESSYDINEYGNTHILKWFNCFDFGNGVESNRIRDDFNEALMDSQVRVSTVVEDGFKEKRNNSGLIFSGIFNSRNGVNRLNEFNTGEAITKELNVEYGSIQKLHGRDSDIIAFTEDKVVKILANKDALYNADGNVNLTSTRAVLGTAVPFAGEFGISKNPESFANYGYQCYFADKARNVVLRLSVDGLTVISAYGISDYIRDIFNSNITNIIGGYDIHTKQYILSLGNTYNSIAFKEGIDGWTSRLSFSPENSIYLNGYFYTFKNGELWLHHSENVNRNTFYGTKYNSTVKFIYNDDPTSIKYFKTLNYEGTQGWKATSIETDQQSGKVLTFIPKEGKWFNNIKGIETTLSNLDPKEFSIQGLGYAGNLIIETTTTTTAAPTTTTTTLATFTCTDAGFSVNDGTVGDPVSAAVIAGTLNSVVPSTYQLGITTYTANITVPIGYSNSGATLTTCTATANGVAIPTTTTTTAAPTTTTTTTSTPTTTTTTATPPTTTTTTTQPSAGSYDCNTVPWASATFDCNTGLISVTSNYGTTTVHSYSPTSATQNTGIVTITYTFSDADPLWDNTNQQFTCTNLSVDTTCTTTTTTTTTAAPTGCAATWSNVSTIGVGSGGDSATACANASTSPNSYYFDGGTFSTSSCMSSSPSSFTAPFDAWYSDGSVARYSTGGSLGSPVTCTATTTTTTTTTVNPNEVAAILLQTDSTTCSDSNSATYSNRIAILASESILVESGGVLKIDNTLSGTTLGLERDIYDSGGSYPYSSKTISTSPTTIGPSYGAWDGLVNQDSLSNPSGNKLFANITSYGTVYFTICP